MAASRGAVVLKTVKKIIVQFCPFESNVRSTRHLVSVFTAALATAGLLYARHLTSEHQNALREFLIVVGSEKARATNMNCEVITDVKHDRSEPTIDITFLDGERLLMKGSKLTTQELLSALQTRCSAKDPQAKAGDKK